MTEKPKTAPLQEWQRDAIRAVPTDLVRSIVEDFSLRAYIHGEIGAAALLIEPSKVCARLISGLEDAVSNLEALLHR